MPALCFSDACGTFCQVTLADAAVPEAIAQQLEQQTDVWFDVQGLSLDEESSEIANPDSRPVFFEWQRLDWLFEPAAELVATPPYRFYVNGVLEPYVTCREYQGRYRLTGATNLGNSVGKTRFTITDNRGKQIFALGAEVFPQKLDYKADFPAMLEEITEVIYSLAFDAFKKTFASTKTRNTYHQTLSEWLNLYKVLAIGFEQAVDTILRGPKSELKCETRIKVIDKVKRASQKAINQALKKPERFCRGAGLRLTPSLALSHLQEQQRKVSYDTQENRFVVWALKDIIQHLKALKTEMQKRDSAQGNVPRLTGEIDFLSACQRKLRMRLLAPAFRDVGPFNHQNQFSTTLTMAAGYKEFYHRYLLLRKGLSLAQNDIFNMDYKDVATLYEYWCFLKTIKLLRDNPKYDLQSNDIIKIEHQRFVVNLKKGVQSAVHFKQRASGDEISIFYNREFSKEKYTHTFKQAPDNFIEFSRAGYANSKDRKTFKVVLDAKYRFDRGTTEYPASNTPFGPPLDAIAQIHRYRDAILWNQDSNDSVKVANKSIGGVILFPYPNSELEFIQHPFYQSIAQVNIGAIPLQPGAHRANQLYSDYLDSLFERSGEALSESRIRYDSRQYDQKRQSQKDLVMVGLVPKNNRDARWEYHNNLRCFYTRWHRQPKFPLEKVKVLALYDQLTKSLMAWADVEEVEFLLGRELTTTGTTWPPRSPDEKHCLYRLGTLNSVNLAAGEQMSGHRDGRFFISRLGLELALEQNNANLLFIHSWPKYQEWKALSTQFATVNVNRISHSDDQGRDVSELIFTPENNKE